MYLADVLSKNIHQKVLKQMIKLSYFSCIQIKFSLKLDKIVIVEPVPSDMIQMVLVFLDMEQIS